MTASCSYNRCVLCSMYDRTPFRVSPMEEVEAAFEAIRSFCRLRDAGSLAEQSEGETIEEEKLLISLITAETCFFSNQAFNLLPVRGLLPCDRERLVAYLTAAAARLGAEILAKPVRRQTEI